MDRSLLFLSVNYVSLSCILDSTSQILQKLDVVDFSGVLWTCVVLFNQLLVWIAQLVEARYFVEERFLRDAVAPTYLVAAQLLGKLDSTVVCGILNRHKQLNKLCVIDPALAATNVG